MRVILGIFRRVLPILAAVLAAVPALSREIVGTTDAGIRNAIVRDSVDAYLATGRPCACPYSTTRSGASCGGRSAYSRPGGAVPLCFSGDVIPAMIAAYQQGRR